MTDLPSVTQTPPPKGDLAPGRDHGPTPHAPGPAPLRPDAPGQGGADANGPWRMRIVITLLLVLAGGVVLFTNRWLSERFTETTRNRAELRLALYSGNMISELQRTSVVPLLISGDPALVDALKTGNFAITSRKLIQVQAEIGVASIQLLDRDGRTVAATNRTQLGESLRNQPQFIEAQRTRDTVFSAIPRPGGAYDFVYSRAVMVDAKLAGVIVVAADLSKYERAWAGLQDAVLVTDSEGTVILATEPRWRGLPLTEVLAARNVPSALTRALEATQGLTDVRPDAYLRGEAVLRTDTRVPFRGWRMVAFTAYDSVREKVNGVLALEIMGFAMTLALTFYLMSRRALSQSAT
ncbi:MAG: sensor histidine kinase, partial [Rhodobacteraceae bacterium]|nr:sensor histidine kinase [Paracoccaceae bacterium]